MTTPKISIIGGGLSAIYAYWGCKKSGFQDKEIEVLVNSLHMSPGPVFMYYSPISFPRISVKSILVGTAEGYSKNQWGRTDVKTSVSYRFPSVHNNIVTEDLYNAEVLSSILREGISNVVKCDVLEPSDIADLQARRHAVICTFPDPNVKEQYRERGDLIAYGVSVEPNSQSDYLVIYNGQESAPWVRKTFFPQKTYTEYPHQWSITDIKKYEQSQGKASTTFKIVPDLLPSTVPLSPEQRVDGNLLRVGRQACFDPKFLSHHAIETVKEFLVTLL